MHAFLSHTNHGLYVYIDNETIAEFSPSGRAVPEIKDGVLHLRRWNSKTKKGSFLFSQTPKGLFYGRVGDPIPNYPLFSKTEFAFSLTQSGISISLAITDPSVLRAARRGKERVSDSVADAAFDELAIQAAVSLINGLPDTYRLSIDTTENRLVIRKEQLFT